MENGSPARDPDPGPPSTQGCGRGMEWVGPPNPPLGVDAVRPAGPTHRAGRAGRESGLVRTPQKRFQGRVSGVQGPEVALGAHPRVKPSSVTKDEAPTPEFFLTMHSLTISP